MRCWCARAIGPRMFAMSSKRCGDAACTAICRSSFATRADRLQAAPEAATMTYEHIKLTRAGAIATLLLDRPQSRKSMTPAMGEEIVRAVEELHHDSGVRVVVITGSGKSFSSGGDLSMLARDTGAQRDSAAPSMEGSPRDFYTRYLSIRQ